MSGGSGPRAPGPGRPRMSLGRLARRSAVVRSRLDRQQTVEEVAIFAQSRAQILGVGLTVVPLRFELTMLLVEGRGQLLQYVAHQGVRVRDGAARVVDEPLLDRLPAGPEVHGGLLLEEMLLGTRGVLGRCRSGLGPCLGLC